MSSGNEFSNSFKEVLSVPFPKGECEVIKVTEGLVLTFDKSVEETKVFAFADALGEWIEMFDLKQVYTEVFARNLICAAVSMDKGSIYLVISTHETIQMDIYVLPSPVDIILKLNLAQISKYEVVGKVRHSNLKCLSLVHLADGLHIFGYPGMGLGDFFEEEVHLARVDSVQFQEGLFVDDEVEAHAVWRNVDDGTMELNEFGHRENRDGTFHNICDVVVVPKTGVVLVVGRTYDGYVAILEYANDEWTRWEMPDPVCVGEDEGCYDNLQSSVVCTDNGSHLIWVHADGDIWVIDCRTKESRLCELCTPQDLDVNGDQKCLLAYPNTFITGCETRDLIIVQSYIRKVYNTEKFQDVQRLPKYLVELVTHFCTIQVLTVMISYPACKQWCIQLDEVFSSCGL